MREKVSTDLAVSRIAERQHGLVSTQQLRRCGLNDDAVTRRVAAGRLFRMHRGVYAVGHPARTDRARWKAATLAVCRSALSHRSAAELWGMLQAQGGDPQVTHPYPASAAKRSGLRIYRSRSLTRLRSRSEKGSR